MGEQAQKMQLFEEEVAQLRAELRSVQEVILQMIHRRGPTPAPV